MSLTFKLDEAPQLSLSVDELNAELVGMRKAVKIAKAFVFRDLVQYLRRLRRKLSYSQSEARLKQKITHREFELNLLRELSVIRLCKLLLANERTKHDLNASGHQLTAQDRLVARLAEAKPVHNFVERFRKEHADWRSLTHYMLYKNISGKWKSREQKKRNQKVIGSLPLPPVSTDLIQDNAHDAGITSTADSEPYRVPVANDLHEPPPPSISPDHPLFPYPSADLDSDSASDIADDIVERIIGKRHKPGSPVFDDPSPLSEEQKPVIKQDSNGEHKSMIKTAKVRFPIDPQPTDLDDSENERSSEQSKPSIGESDDENPLGNDDVEMKQKLSSRASRNRSSRARHGPLHSRGRPPPRYSTSSTRNVTGRFTSGAPGSHVSATTSANKSLHPSWQAKREQKLKGRISSVALCTSPTKHIVFDD
ncbi:hypothetical protein D915_006976 [Fasciola hepatica]|uniref:Serum response factor-binding protein 1 n=1 Tax=Fasciola hepatica TaxID=6192 RepID=A0A4E0R5F7_FASHE|nr:hypothetical protein D915_006976 [Fasciola hepatica]